MNLVESQQKMLERENVARKKRRQKAGSKRKRTRKSVKTLLVNLAEHAKAPGKVRAWAIQQLLLLGGKPVQPFEESYDEPESKPESVPAFTGRDLGKPEVRISLDEGRTGPRSQ
jgi:hypothetical protein